jgi:hypothetical protein
MINVVTVALAIILSVLSRVLLRRGRHEDPMSMHSFSRLATLKTPFNRIRR